MTKEAVIEAALRLSSDEKADLVQVVTESLEAEQEAAPLTDWQRELLIERLEASRRNPENTSTWEEMRTRILERVNEPQNPTPK